MIRHAKTTSALLRICLLAIAAVNAPAPLIGADSTDDQSERFPIDPVNGLMVPVEVFGQRCRFVINTSLDFSALHDSFYGEMSKLGKPKATKFPTNVPGYELFVPAELKVGRGLTDVSNTQGYECGLTSAHRVIFSPRGPDCKGAISMDRLNQKVLRVNFDEGWFQIAETAIADPAAHSEVLRSKVLAPTILIKISDEGFHGMTINSAGLNDLIIDSELFNKLSKRGRIKIVRPPLKTAKSRTPRIGILDHIEIGPFGLDNVVVEESAKDKGLGLAQLRRFNVEFDFANGRAYFQPNSRFRERCRYDRSGLTFAASEPSTVLAVTPDSAAEKAGITPGDIVGSLNGIDMEQLPLLKVRNLLSEPGAKITMTLQHDGTTRELTLNLSNEPDPFEPKQQPAVPATDFEFDK